PFPLEVAATGALAFDPNQRPPFSLSACLAQRARFLMDCHSLRTEVDPHSVSPRLQAVIEVFVGEPVGCAHSAETLQRLAAEGAQRARDAPDIAAPIDCRMIGRTAVISVAPAELAGYLIHAGVLHLAVGINQLAADHTGLGMCFESVTQ